VKSPHLLRAAPNARRLVENLKAVVDATAIASIEGEILLNVRQLYLLGREQYRFAGRQTNAMWRQKVSRLYYGAYNVSRAVRFCVHGDYSTEVGDHKKFDQLPDDFPNVNTYSNRLAALRDDRNVCDYDHTANRQDLLHAPEDSMQLVSDFLRDARDYLRNRGVTI
jgi:hypothetical protein